MSDSAYEAHSADHRMIERMLFFSDAVFAIVLTLLVLELRPPHGETEAELAAGLSEMTVHFFAFTISFALGGVFWLAHMRTLRLLRHFDWWTAGANLLHLLTVALTPFASAILGEHIDSTTAFQAYSFVMVLVAFSSMLTWLVASRGNGRLMGGGVTFRHRIGVALRTSGIGWCFLASLLLTMAGFVSLARFTWVLMAPLMVIAGWISGKRPVERSSARDAA